MWKLRKIVDSAGEIPDKRIQSWRGRPVIPTAKWEGDYDAFPDGLVLLTHDAPTEWVKDYTDMLMFLRDDRYGRLLCKGCILDPNAQSAPYRIVRKYLLEDSFTNPCQVVNWFKCPCEERKDHLFRLGNIANIIDRMIHAYGYLKCQEWEKNFPSVEAKETPQGWAAGKVWGEVDQNWDNEDFILSILTDKEKLQEYLDAYERQHGGLGEWRECMINMSELFREKIKWRGDCTDNVTNT